MNNQDNERCDDGQVEEGVKNESNPAQASAEHEIGPFSKSVEGSTGCQGQIGYCLIHHK